jgi:hypothetical protein
MRLFQLLLDAKLVGVSAFLLAAVGCARGKASVALAAHLLVAVELLCKSSKGGLNHTTTKSEHQVKGGFLLDVVVRQGAAIFELLASKDQSLLIRRDAFLVLDLCLYILDGITGFDIKSDGLAREGLDKDLHLIYTKRERGRRERERGGMRLVGLGCWGWLAFSTAVLFQHLVCDCSTNLTGPN